MNTKNIIEVFNNELVIVRLDFHGTTGMVSFNPEKDLKLPDGTSLPPKEYVKWGSKQAINPADLKPFKRFYSAAKHLCGKYGLSCLGGYAIPYKVFEEKVQPQLDEFVTAHIDAKDDFLAAYMDRLNDWCAKSPEWADIIRDKAPTLRYLQRQISAGYTTFSIQPSGACSGGETGLSNYIGGLSQDLYEDIAKHANKFLNESIYQKDESGNQIKACRDVVTVAALRPIRFMRDKMQDLQFIAPGIETLIQDIDEVLDGMPSKGKIENKALNRLYQLTLILSDTDKMRDYTANTIFAAAAKDEDDLFSDDLPSFDSVEFDPDSTEENVADEASVDATAADSDVSIEVEADAIAADVDTSVNAGALDTVAEVVSDAVVPEAEVVMSEEIPEDLIASASFADAMLQDNPVGADSLNFDDDEFF